MSDSRTKNAELEEDLKLEGMLKELYKQPLKIYDEDLENLKWGYTSKELTHQMLKTALERGEITIQQFINIIKQ